jgi:hypothetical protein
VNLTNWLYLCFGLASANMLAAHLRNRSFLLETPAISSTADIERFKSLARWNMYSALLQIGLLGAAGMLGVIGLVKGQVGILLILVLNGAILALSKYAKGMEARTQSLEVREALLETQYRSICSTWLHRAFPDF